MSYFYIIIIKTAAILLFSGMLFIYYYLKKRQRKKETRFFSIIMIILGIAFWLNLGIFRSNGQFVHKTEHFHYFVGSKYFPELKYDGLYVAAIAARQKIIPNYVPPLFIRDLRTNRVDAFENLKDHIVEVRARFSKERWTAFKTDMSVFQFDSTVFLDHGYNPPPPHTFISRIFTSWLPVTETTMLILSFIDIALIIGVCLLVAFFFNRERAAFMSIVLGIGLLYYFGWNGGALLRFDWLFALILSVCFLHKKKPLFSGMSFAYAVAVRIFPILFVTGLVIYWFRKKNFKNIQQYAAGFIIIMIILLILGGFAGTGVSAYSNSYDNFKNFKIWTTGIGLRYLLISSWENVSGKTVDPYSLHLTDEIGDDYAETQSERMVLVISITALALLVVGICSASARTPVEAFAMGCGFLFAAVPLGTYYWVVLVLVVFFRPKFSVKASLLMNFLMFTWFLCALLLIHFQIVPFFYAALVFFPASIILFVFFVFWFRRILITGGISIYKSVCHKRTLYQ